MATGTDAATSEGIMYTYECRSCSGEAWRVRHHMDETPPQTCPHCGSDDTYRPLWVTRVTLEGGGVGWERDGYNAHHHSKTSLTKLGNKVTETSKEAFEADLSKMVEKAK